MLFRSDRKSTRLNSSHTIISYAVFCLKKKKQKVSYDDRQRDGERQSSHQQPTPDSPPTPPAPVARERVAPHPPPTPFLFFFFNDTATTEIYTLSLPDALPISRGRCLPLAVPRCVRQPMMLALRDRCR